MNMEQMKRAMISTFGNIRKRNRRLVCILMVGIMFATQTDLPRVFAEAGEEVNEAESAADDTAAGDDADQAADTVLITGFEELPAEVAGQTVAPGTPYEALVLPEKLTAYIGNEADHSGENGEEDEAEENTGKEDETDDNSGEAGDDAEDNDGSEGDSSEDSDSTDGNGTDDNDSTDGDGADEDSAGDTGNTDENAPEDGSTEGEEPENSDSADEGNTEGNSDETGDKPEDNGAEDEDNGDESGDKPENDGVADGAETAAANADGDGNDSGVKQDNAEYGDGNSAKTAQYEAHTTTVTLPAYQSENILTVETLEQSPGSAEDSPEATDTKTSEDSPEPSDESGQTAVVIPGITWESAPAYGSDIQGEYIFTPVLPEGYCVGEEVALPTIAVTVEQSAARPRRALARAAAADGTHQDHSGWTEMRSNTTTLTSGNYYLTADMSNGVTIQSGATVNLCLNGYTLSVNSSIYEAAVTVESGATLNVYDCVGSGSIKYAYRSKKMPGIRTEGNVNVYGGTISGKDGGIQASGTAEVNLYGGIVNGEESNGIYLDSGARLLIDGGEVRNKLTDLNNNATGAVFMAQGSSAELRSGKVYAESVGNNVYNNRVMCILPDCRFTMSGGTLDYAGENSRDVLIGVPYNMTVTGGDALVEITGGTVNCNWSVSTGELTVNDTEIKGRIGLGGGVMKIQGSQPIGTALTADEPDIVILFQRGSTEQRLDAIELTGPLTYAGGYTIQLSEAIASSSYPITVTRRFSTYMPGKEPSDCFTYLKKDQRNDYKMVLSGGEVTLLPYVMTFDANGGTLAEDEKKGDITGAQYMRSLPVPTRDGYDFDGWYKEAADGTEVTVDAMPHEDITVYAHWTPITYDITYDLAGGTLPAGQTNPTAYQIESAAFTLHNPERTGYTFTGWSGTGLTGSANKTVTVAKGSMGERTYTANWKVNTYTVTLNGNGGSGTALTGYTYGTGATLPADWTRTGYTFAGWYDNAGLTGSAVTAIAADEVGNKTYYAKWTANTYTVTYHKNEGTITNETNYTSYTYGTGLTLPTPVRTGYTFGGWYENVSFTGTKATSIGKSITGNKIYYAKWTANSYTVTYHKNGGMIANETNYTGYTYGTGLMLPTPVRTGYTFGGWYENEDCIGTAAVRIADTDLGDREYWAKWTANSYTVTYYKNGGTIANETNYSSYTYGTGLTLPTPVRTGYTFGGWYTEADFAEMPVTSIATNATGNKTYYAKWTANSYTVTYHKNGGTIANETDYISYTYGTGLTLPTPIRTGCMFGGWYADAEFTGTPVTGIDPGATGDKIYYAKWTANTYNVTYHKNEGTITNETNYTSYTYGTGLTLPTPVRTGYTFGGWYTGANFTGTPATSIAANATGNKTYYAKWTVNTYTVTYHKDNGTIANEADYISYTYGTGLTLPTPVRTGCTFGGWYENEDCTGTAAVRIADTDLGDREYWAKWSPKQYTVTFAYQGATGGDGIASMPVTYDSAYGTLPQPEKDGYAFQGWYTQADGQGSQIVSTTKVTTDADHVLYAFWKDSEAPDAPALQSGVTIPADWTNAQSTIPLVLTDNVGVMKLWVKVDNGDFMPVEDFAGSGVSTQYAYTALEGSHTYAFKTADAAGNESDISVFTVKLDTAKPVLGPLSYENKAATLWQWIIGKKSMIIHVPVSDDGSGVTQIRYVMTPVDADGSYDDSRKEEKTAAVVDGQAKITFPQEEAYQGFRGRIVITCADLAGNAADSVTVGMTEGMNGVLVEDTAPVITAMADRLPTDMTAAQPGGTAVSEDYYETAPALMVTVSDDTDHQITAGIASVTYQAGDTPAQSVAVGTDTMQSRIQFTVPASEIPTGVTAIRVTALDHAGNEAAETYTVRVKGPERKPAAVIDYRAEKLKGFVPNAKYSINGVSYTADEQGCVPVEEAWMGTTLAIVKCGNGNEMLDSEAQSLTIPVRPQTPAPAAQDETGPNRKDGRLTGLTGNTAYEISVDGGRTWESRTTDADGVIAGLAPDSYVVRVAATDVSFASRVSESPAVIKAYRIKVVFMANDEAYTTLYTSYGESITQIPEVPAKRDAGEQLYEGAWCDAQGNPAVFTNIQADMTVYAVYTAFYTVTLQEGRGYTLTAASGSLSPVKEGGSYGFTFALQKGYRKNAKFTVKVNGVAAEPAEDGSYVMEDIRENKAVTVEGVVKKTSGSKPGNPEQPGGGSSGDSGQPGGGDPSGDGGQSDGGNGSGDNGQPGSGNPSGGSSQPGGGNPSGDNGQPGGGNPSGDNGQPDGKKPPEDEAPMTGTRPSGTGTPPAGRTPSDQDGSDGTAPTGTDSGNPSEDDGDVTDTTPGNVEAQGTSPTDTEPTAGTEPEGEIVQTLSAAIDGGRIVLTDDNAVDGGSAAAGGNIATGNVNGMPGTSTVLELGEGAVVVKVICTEQNCSAGVEDTVAVANAVLTQTHMELVSNGEVIEIRIDVKDISSQVPEQDQEVIESGIQAYEREIPGLKLGMYVDISMFIRSGQADWQAVTETVEPVAAVIGIPSGLQEDGREYYIIRAHEGEYTLLRDTDEAPDTITISTDRFSSYAIAWQESGAAGSRCGLCHICPTFLGICCFVWLAVIAVAAFAVLVIMLRRRKSAE